MRELTMTTLSTNAFKNDFQVTWTIDLELKTESPKPVREDYVTAAREALSMQGKNSLALAFEIHHEDQTKKIDLLSEDLPELNKKLFIDNINAGYAADIDGTFVKDLGTSKDHLIFISEDNNELLPEISITLQDIASVENIVLCSEGLIWNICGYKIRFYDLTPVIK